MENKVLGLLLLFIVLASGIGTNMVEVEGKTCSKPSKYYHGWCVAGCGGACKKENWPQGECEGYGFKSHCVCKRPC